MLLGPCPNYYCNWVHISKPLVKFEKLFGCELCYRLLDEFGIAQLNFALKRCTKKENNFFKVCDYCAEFLERVKSEKSRKINCQYVDS